MKCGHHQSLSINSAETGAYLYCDLCDAKSRCRDAEAMEAELRAALAAQPAPAAVPPGYALVPIEPTPEMIDAGLGKLLYVASPQPRHIYRAMIAAAGDNT